MRKHGLGQMLDVRRTHEIPFAEAGQCLAGAEERQGATCRDAELEFAVFAGAADDPQYGLEFQIYPTGWIGAGRLEHSISEDEVLSVRTQAMELWLTKDLEGKAFWAPLWVTDFPMFEKNEKGQFVSSHHPFTHPRDEHVDALVSDPAMRTGTGGTSDGIVGASWSHPTPLQSWSKWS